MKKILFLLIICLLTGNSTYAGIISDYKAKAEYNKIYKSTLNQIKEVINTQNRYANEHNLKALESLYSKDFTSSDGYNLDIYMQMVKDTWETYPDITYITKIESIDFTDNYATVITNEIAIAAPVEKFEEIEAPGELYSEAVSIYQLKNEGTHWLVTAEYTLEEKSTLKFGDARYINMKLNAPKQIGADKDYIVTLKVNAPENTEVIASIGKEKIIYPQDTPENNFRKLSNDVLERVFHSNKDNVNEYSVASVVFSQTNNEGNIYLNGLAFIMTRINVIYNNKFIEKRSNNGKDR